jgi:hypothetical protein
LLYRDFPDLPRLSYINDSTIISISGYTRFLILGKRESRRLALGLSLVTIFTFEKKKKKEQ